jgi:hypothetical protein
MPGQPRGTHQRDEHSPFSGPPHEHLRPQVLTIPLNNHKRQGKDYRSQPCWSARKKTNAVLRLLPGESLEELSRELKVEAHRLAAWRDDSLAAGKHGLKASGVTGQLTTER